MSNDAYGDLGNRMKAMKDGRVNLMEEIKDNHKRIRAETGQTLAAADRFVVETGKANEKLAAQTRQMMAQARRDLKARAGQTLTDATRLAAAIRKGVAALKADAGRIITDASGFLARTGSDNARLRVQTRKMLAHARTESKAQTRQALAEAGKAMVRTRAAVAGLRTDTTRVLADAAGVMQRLCTSSRQRAAGWRDVLRTVHGGRRAPAGASVAAAPAQRPAKTKPRGKKKASAKS